MVTMVGRRSDNIEGLLFQFQQVGISWVWCGEVGLSGDGLQCGLGQSGGDVGGIRQDGVVGRVDGDIGLSVLVQVNGPVVQVVDELLGGINSDLTLGTAWSSLQSLGMFNLGGGDFRGILDGYGEIVGEDVESASIGCVADAHLLAGRVDVSIRADAVTSRWQPVRGKRIAIRNLAKNILSLVTASVESGVAVVAAVREPLGRSASQEERNIRPAEMKIRKTI